MSKTTDSLSSTCVLCCQSIKIYAIGPCDHPICYKCSTKMRVICNQMYCAVCRSEMPKTIFTFKQHPYDGIISHKFHNDRKFGIFFANNRIHEEYRKILSHKCQLCGIRRDADDSFKKLQDHMRREHELFACQLCVDNVKVLSYERKFYSRRELAVHRRSGDPDDKSYKGHPNCEFCDERYFDKDELHRHLRKDHYFCHFCEADGVTNQFYSDYQSLEEHFRSDHFLCEEEACREEKFTAAFRTEIDFKAHKAKVHSGKMTKLQARQTRQVDVEFNLPARPRDRGYRDRDGPYSGGGRGGRDRYQHDRRDRETARAIEASLDSAKKEEATRDRKKKAAKEKRPPRDSPTEELTRQEEPRVKAGAEEYKEPRTRTGAEERRETRTKPRAEENKEQRTRACVEDNKDTRTRARAEENKEARANREVLVQTSAAVVEKKPPDVRDFPMLSDQPTAFSSFGGKWSTLKTEADDFPALGNGDGGPDNMPLNVAASFGFYSSLVNNNQSTFNPIPVEPSQPQQSALEMKSEEFPTLSSIASLLGGNTKKNNKAKKKKNKQAAQEDVRTDNADKYITHVTENIYKAAAESRKESAAEKEKENKISRKVEHSAFAQPKKNSTLPSSATSSISATPSVSVAPAISTASIARPPPGFAAMNTTLSSSMARAPPPGFNALPTPSSDPEFVQPPNFKQRNRDLVFKIQEFCAGKDELFAQFKHDSGEFRQGLITASEYYQRCMDTLSEDNFHRIINELVTLLPDVAKQQQLLTAHSDYKASRTLAKQDTVLKISNTIPTKSGKTTAWKASASKVDNSTCPVCSQVVLTKDLTTHMNAHEEFPALSAARPAPKAAGVANKAWGKPTWGRGK